MNDEHKIVQQVYTAKEDVQAADRLIDIYALYQDGNDKIFKTSPPLKGMMMS